MAQSERDPHTGKQQFRPQDVRAAAFISELNQAADAYRDVLREYEGVRQRFEIARERLRAMQRRASDILPRRDWADWEYHNEDLWAIGTEIGEAILISLRGHAVDAAMKSLDLDSKGVVEWDPTATTEQIMAALDEHGFEFKTGTPKREVHAALLRLKGVSKTKDGRFAHGEAREIYASMQEGWPRDETERVPTVETLIDEAERTLDALGRDQGRKDDDNPIRNVEL